MLHNRLPEERAIYLQLVDEKERWLRQKIQTEIKFSSVRYIHGKIKGCSNLPDVDLAIVKDTEKIAFVIELKWFIEPSEPREVLEKSKEIEKGISQALLLSEAAVNIPNAFHEFLGIDETYSLHFLVLSANFIGFDTSQHAEIPVINADHFVKKMNNSTSFRVVLDWLKNQEYLPSEGQDYKYFEEFWQIGQWKLKWYALKPLTTKEFI